MPTYDDKLVFVEMRQAAEILLRAGLAGDDFSFGRLDATDSADVARINLMDRCIAHQAQGYRLLAVSRSTPSEAVNALYRAPRNEMQDWILIRRRS